MQLKEIWDTMSSFYDDKRILHVGGTAGISMILSKYQSRAGADAKCLFRVSEDAFEYREIYDKWVIPHDGRVRWYALKMLKEAFRAEIVHIHSADILLPVLKRIYPNKPVILTYHNTKITETWEERREYWEKADIVTIATPQLIENAPIEVPLTPNIIDTEHFVSKSDSLPNSALVFDFDQYGDTSEGFKRNMEFANQQSLNTHVYRRDKYRIPHKVFPRFLDVFEYYLDIRSWYGKILDAISTTALQMLAMGGKIYFDGNVYDKLPEEHIPSVVIQNWAEIYRQLIE